MASRYLKLPDPAGWDVTDRKKMHGTCPRCGTEFTADVMAAAVCVTHQCGCGKSYRLKRMK